MFKLSSRVLTIPAGGKVVLLNTYNGTMVEVDDTQIINGVIQNISPKEEKYLLEKNFDLELSVDELKQIYFNESNVFNLTIELTKKCNLQCAYCYQREWDCDKNEKITSEILDKIYMFLRKQLDGKIKYFLLSFIGGEPLLESDLLLKIYNEIKAICDERQIVLQVYIDTNSTIMCEKLKEINNLTLNVTLSPKEDHNKLRNGKKQFDCYSLVLNNIKKYQLFNNLIITLRYNVNEKNKNLLDEYITKLIEEGVNVHNIDLAYTVSHNEFVNDLSRKDYYKWLYNEAFFILKKHNLPIRYFPEFSFYPCSAYSQNSYKIHCDGKVSLCDSWDINKSKFTINDLLEKYEAFRKEYANIKGYFPLSNSKCLDCKYILLCGGYRFCEKKPCEKFEDINDLIINFQKTIDKC